jgi:hypothetical protein
MTAPFPTWPDHKRRPFSLLCALHATRQEARQVPDRVLDDLTARGWVEVRPTGAGIADHHGLVRPTAEGIDIIRLVPRSMCYVAATEGVRLLAALRSGDVVLDDEWRMVLLTLSRWREWSISEWRHP